MNPDFSLIDANIRRAGEGLRVLEDIARFVLRDAAVWEKLKTVRHSVATVGSRFGMAQLIGSREGGDIGSKTVVLTEYQRQTLYSILLSNSHRTTQALRTLEEFAKLYMPAVAYMCENMRYEVYVLEHALAKRMPHYWLQSYFSNGTVYPISDNVSELIFLIERGATIVQLRDKISSVSVRREKAKAVCRFLTTWNATALEPALCILNDDVDGAARLPVAGIHIGQDVKDVGRVRRLLGSNKIIGRSNNSLEQMHASVADGADYTSIGPVFSTPTKPDRTSVGLDMLQTVAKEITTPWVAIGGIDMSNEGDVRATGARNVAVVRSAREFFALSHSSNKSPKSTQSSALL